MLVVILKSTRKWSVVSQKGSCSGHLVMNKGKDMNGLPTSVYHVAFVRNTGWPTGRESYGHRVLIVVVGVTPHQGDGSAVHRAKQDRLDNH